MTHAFAGMVLLPGEDGDGLAAVLQTAPEDIRLSAGAEELGSWSTDDMKIAPVGKGVFAVDLAGEQILFTPETPAQFAEAMTVPLQPERTDTSKQTSVRKEEKSRLKREKQEAKMAKARAKAVATQEKEVLGKGLTVAVVGVSAAVMGALVAISVTL